MTERQGDVSTAALSPAQSARRQRIIDAAKDLLSKQPYEQIQMRDVVKAAGVALGTLYRYFSSKEHLYAVVITSWVAPDPNRLAAPDQPAVERLRSKMHYVVAAYERRPNFYAAQVTLTSTAEPIVRDLISDWSTRSTTWLLEDLASLPEQRARDMARMLLAINSATLTRAVLHGGSFAEAIRIIDIFLDIIADELEAAERQQADA